MAEAKRKDSTSELEGCLFTLRATLRAGDCRLRLTIHRPDGDSLEQITDYVGDTPRPGRIGRKYPANAGIIGRAYRERETFVARRVSDDYEAYVRELITDWNYTEERARKLNPGAMAWMAYPFVDAEGRVEAVMFLDANEREFFTPERQELVLAAARGIAHYVGRRYT